VEARGNESSAQIRGELVALLRSHSEEVEQALVARYLSSDMGRDLDTDSVSGLRLAATEVVRVLLARLEEGDLWSTDLPPGIAAPIQYMAREGMSLDRVLRGLTIVATTIGEFVAEHMGELAQPEEAMRYMANLRSLNDDRLMAAFAAEYEQELERLDSAPSRRLWQRIDSLLDGGLGDFADLDYRLEGFHVGLIAMGVKAELACRRLAETLGCDLLLLPRTEETIWAWLGARRQISFAELERAAAGGETPLAIAAGESRFGLEGWRTTHREARECVTVAMLQRTRVTRYSDVALLATALSSEVMGRSLLDRYLRPLDQQRDGGGLRGTLRTYLELNCNAASAAAALKVDRHTVQRRLRRIEESVGESVSTRRAEFGVALRLEDMTVMLDSLAEGESIDHVVPIQLPARTPLAHPEQHGR